jgi:hypothetical protein
LRRFLRAIVPNGEPDGKGFARLGRRRIDDHGETQPRLRGARTRGEPSRIVERIGVCLIHLLDHCDGKNARVGQRRSGTHADFGGRTRIELRQLPHRIRGASFESPLCRLPFFQHQSWQGTESNGHIRRRLCAEIAQCDHAIDQAADHRCRVIGDHGQRQVRGRGKCGERCRRRICQIWNRQLPRLKSKPGTRWRDRNHTRRRGKCRAPVIVRDRLEIHRAGQLQSHAGQRTQVAARDGHCQRLIRSSGARKVRRGYNEEADECETEMLQRHTHSSMGRQNAEGQSSEVFATSAHERTGIR